MTRFAAPGAGSPWQVGTNEPPTAAEIQAMFQKHAKPGAKTLDQSEFIAVCQELCSNLAKNVTKCVARRTTLSFQFFARCRLPHARDKIGSALDAAAADGLRRVYPPPQAHHHVVRHRAAHRPGREDRHQAHRVQGGPRYGEGPAVRAGLALPARRGRRAGWRRQGHGRVNGGRRRRGVGGGLGVGWHKAAPRRPAGVLGEKGPRKGGVRATTESSVARRIV